MDYFRRSKNLVLTNFAARAILEALDPGVGGTGVPVIPATAEIALFTNQATPTPASVLGDFELAALSTGTEVATAAISEPINLPNDQMGIKHQAEWVAGAAPTQETIRGYVVYIGADLWAAERFSQEDEIPIVAQGDYVSLDVVLAAIAKLVATGLS